MANQARGNEQVEAIEAGILPFALDAVERRADLVDRLVAGQELTMDAIARASYFAPKNPATKS